MPVWSKWNEVKWNPLGTLDCPKWNEVRKNLFSYLRLSKVKWGKVKPLSILDCPKWNEVKWNLFSILDCPKWNEVKWNLFSILDCLKWNEVKKNFFSILDCPKWNEVKVEPSRYPGLLKTKCCLKYPLCFVAEKSLSGRSNSDCPSHLLFESKDASCPENRENVQTLAGFRWLFYQCFCNKSTFCWPWEPACFHKAFLLVILFFSLSLTGYWRRSDLHWGSGNSPPTQRIRDQDSGSKYCSVHAWTSTVWIWPRLVRTGSGCPGLGKHVGSHWSHGRNLWNSAAPPQRPLLGLSAQCLGRRHGPGWRGQTCT